MGDRPTWADRSKAPSAFSREVFLISIDLRGLLLLTLIVHLGAQAGYAAPSFDCGKGLTPVEETICADGSLAKLDAQLAEAYLAVRDSGARAPAVDSQSNWLELRDRKCEPPEGRVACLSDLYEKRLEGLSLLREGYWSLLNGARERLRACDGDPQPLRDTGITQKMIEAEYQARECYSRLSSDLFSAYFGLVQMANDDDLDAYVTALVRAANSLHNSLAAPDSCFRACGSMWIPISKRQVGQLLRKVVDSMISRLELEKGG